MSVPNLKIAGIEISLHEWPASQSYASLEQGQTLHRMASGAAFAQQHWRKSVIRINGVGWAPPALQSVDFSAAIVISCISPRSIASATVNATLPTARRSDAAPYAAALVDGKLVNTPMSLVGNAATATAVSGASGYRFFYYPELTCLALRGVEETLSTETGAFTWSLEAEEI